MKKYLGNKSKIVNKIYEAVSDVVSDNENTIFDAFAGTTNVGRHFRSKGFNVISNDINDVSYILGKTYLELKEVPTFEKLLSSKCFSSKKYYSLIGSEEFILNKQKFRILNNNTTDQKYLENAYNSNFYNILVYLTFYSSKEDFFNDVDDAKFHIQHEDFIFRNYCEEGSNSEYINLVTKKSLIKHSKEFQNIKKTVINFYSDKQLTTSLADTIDEISENFINFSVKPYRIERFDNGIKLLEKTVDLLSQLGDEKLLNKVLKSQEKLLKMRKRDNHIGRRMFFTTTHGQKIDVILNTILYWYKNEFIEESEYNVLLTSLLEAVALFSNTSATYQAFYKDYRDNTQQPFRLLVPEIEPSTTINNVFQEDTVELIRNIEINYDILYLDPPYNWRIYDSNYHLLNFIASYHHKEKLLEYEQFILGASGENKMIERTYTNFNRRDTFEEFLFDPIRESTCKYVVISYSDSNSNHNKDLSSVEKITRFLGDTSLFVDNSLKIIEVNSQNFESRKNEKKIKVKELLFIAKKKR